MKDEFDSRLPASQPLDAPHGPLEVRPHCHSVGHRNPAALLQCNTYVRSFEGAGSPVHVCVDPGSQFDYPVIEANINQLIGDIGELSSFSLNHQDPDVVGNALYLCDANPDISAMVTEDVWRLVQHLLLRPKRVHFANVARSRMTTVGDRHQWRLVPTPFCHFRGAMAFYDPELRTLFSGDLFGGLNQLGRVQLLAEAQDWAGIAQFHQIYMPTREALRHAVRQIRALQPAVEVIAPQHGHVIAGDLVPLFMEKMYDLQVGHDLLAQELDATCLAGYRETAQRLLATASEQLGPAEGLRRLEAAEPDDGLSDLIDIKSDEVIVKREGYDAISKMFGRLTQGESSEFANQLRSRILAACGELELPVPPIGAGIVEATGPRAIGPDGIATQAWWIE